MLFSSDCERSLSSLLLPKTESVEKSVKADAMKFFLSIFIKIKFSATNYELLRVNNDENAAVYGIFANIHLIIK